MSARHLTRVARAARVACLMTSALLLAAVAPRAAIAQRRDSTALERRTSEIVAMLGGAPIGFDTLFAPSFLAAVPPAQIRQLTRQLATQLGKVTRVERVRDTTDSPTHAQFRLGFSNGFTMPTTVNVAAAVPNLVDGLLFGAPSKDVATLEELMHDFAALPGHVSVLAARLDANGVVPIAALDTNRALGIGSAFKLYVLAELIQRD